MLAHSEIESHLFTLKCNNPLALTERYTVIERKARNQYKLMGSIRCDAIVTADQVLPDGPFVIMREVRKLSPKDKSAHIYQAIIVSDLERLTEKLSAKYLSPSA